MKFGCSVHFLLCYLMIQCQAIFLLPQVINEISKFYSGKAALSFNISVDYHHMKENTQKEESYDFIIVGSGAAGSVLANRLSEIPEWKVLLLEAGSPENLFTDIPVLCAFFLHTGYDWEYKMEKQEGVCGAMENQQCQWPRGKALGGTSVINYMIHTRGNKRDFNRWAAQGNPGWSWRDVVPYYIRSENANLKMNDTGYHGQGGYLDVENVRFRTPLVKLFLKAGKQTGREILDYNGKNQFGFSKVQSSTRKGVRCSASKAFLIPAGKRKNLKILPMSRVTKILIDPKTKTAYGVEYLRNKKTYKALASKEVILSAGAFSSPQLLMLSGIGPQQHLEELDIPVIQNLNVGQNLQDHLTFVGLTFLINQTISITIDRVVQPNSIKDFIFQQTGPLTSIGGVEGLGYIKTNASKEKGNYPDIELIFVAGSVNSDGGGGVRRSFGISQSFYDEVFAPINKKDCWSIIPMLLHPKSRGYLKLKSKNIFHHPILVGNYYTDQENHDLETMLQSVKEVIKLSQTPAFQQVGSKLHDIPFPGCKHLPFGSDDYWRCALKQMPPSLHHQVGTCKMGPATDPDAVVDPRLKVYGINNLRVADTSVIPFALSAHTNAPAFMIGEKTADYIKLDWLNKN